MLTNQYTELNYAIYNDESELEEEDLKLIESARNACKTAYSPYSGFQVGAALLLENDKIVSGSNQENSSYPAGLCAERVALFHAGAEYGTLKVKKIAVTAQKKDSSFFVPVTPCGSCRQVMLEYEIKQNTPIEVIMQIAENKWVKTLSTEVLLPFCFNKDAL
ncbi:cytidine deaminase [Fulvivirga sp. 29W222]|uniref:Cytidine deaminase n=1 Tax=Fulvivirga marina TaxID=2494733 RepID=A0A937KC88_9BACT|nr:cytidine deaminase [Fulvivirga marina]MBL6447257.1 cytidine deaminase [Fulvivirga marina]